MEITYYANACCTYQKDGFWILTDPWLLDGAFDSWAHFPPLHTKPEDLKGIDALYISHCHQDHLHPPTLERLPKVPVIYLDHGMNLVRKNMEKLGFKEFIPIKDKETKQVGPFELTMYAPFAPILYYDSQVGNLIDSALHIKCGDYSIFNANDNLPTIESSKMILERHGQVTLAQLCDSCAGPFPMCFTNLTHKEKLTERDRILERHLQSMIECAKIMKSKYMMPWAGHYALQGRNAHMNDSLAVYESEKVAEKIAQSGIKPLNMKEWDSFNFETEQHHNYLKSNSNFNTWKELVKNRPYSFDDILELPPERLIDLCTGARLKMLEYQHKFNSWPDWNFAIHAGKAHYFDSFNKLENNKTIEFSLDPKLLGLILQRKYHWNDAELGCHIEMDRTPNEYCPDIHLLMSFFHN